MEMTSIQRSPWPLTLAITLALLVAIIAGYRGVYFETTILEQGDMATNALQIDDAKRGQELYGNYSRFQFNHPGPAFWYVYAASEIVLHDWLNVVPSPHNAHLLACLFLQVLSFALAIAIVHCWIDSWSFVAFALLGGIWHFSFAQGAFVSIWPPHVLLMPFLCFIAAVASFASGRTRDLPAMIIAGSFLFHGHVAQPLFVGSLGALAFYLYRREQRARGVWAGLRAWWSQHRGLGWFCAGWIFLMLLPLLIDIALYRSESNFATIVRRFLVNASDEPKSILQSFLYFLSFTTHATNQDELFGQITRETWRFFGEHALVVAAWLGGILGPAALVFRKRADHPPARNFLRTGYLVWFAIVPLCIAWGLVQSGPMWQYNGFFYYGIYYFGALLGLGLVCSVPGRVLPLPVTAALCAVAGISATWLFRASKWNEEDTGQDLRKGVELALKDHTPGRPVLLVFEHYLWPQSASVALELQRRGISFYTAPSWNFMFGRARSSDHLGPDIPAAAEIWWINRPAEGGYPLGRDLELFTKPARIDPRNTEISFAGRANGYRYLISGLSTGNVEFSWTDQKRLQLFFAAPPTEQDVQLMIDAHVNLRAKAAPKTQPADVYLNDTKVGTVAISERNQVSVTLPKEVWNARPVARFELRFPEAARLEVFSRPADQTWTAWGLRRLLFASTASDQARTQFAQAGAEPAAGVLTAYGRIDFTATGNLPQYLISGLGAPEPEHTRVIGNTLNLVFRPEPTADHLLLQIVAQPYADQGKPPDQRCQIFLNGQLIFNSPFTEPGVARAIIGRDLWNSRPLAQLKVYLPDATPADSPGEARQGLAIRWLSLTPQPRP